jgi:histidinol-phosphate phosphatase family protein
MVESEAVIGGSGRPVATAVAGWLARAHVQVLDLDRARVARWGPVGRWAWHSLYGAGLLEERDAEAWRDHAFGLERERLALWSSQPPPFGADATHADTEVLERACERALARQRARAPRPGVFLDRDGTVIREVGYLADPSDVVPLPGAAAALRGLRSAGFPVVLISNQSGVGRGLFPLSRVYQVMARLRERLRAEGVELDAIYFCPHRPEEECRCRKPGTALLERAAEDLLISLRDSVMIGDKLLDTATAHAVGGQGVLVRTGYGRDEEGRIGAEGQARPPDHVCDDLEAAAAWWIERFSATA